MVVFFAEDLIVVACHVQFKQSECCTHIRATYQCQYLNIKKARDFHVSRINVRCKHTIRLLFKLKVGVFHFYLNFFELCFLCRSLFANTVAVSEVLSTGATQEMVRFSITDEDKETFLLFPRASFHQIQHHADIRTICDSLCFHFSKGYLDFIRIVQEET